MARLKLILILIVLLLIAIIAFQNREPVTVSLLTEQFSIPMTLLIFFTAILGFVVGTLFGARIPRNLKIKLPPEASEPAAPASKQDTAADSDSQDSAGT